MRDILRKVIRRYDAVKKYKLDMYVKNKVLIIKVIVNQFEAEGIKEITDALSDDMKARLYKVAGLKGNLEVHIKVNNFEEKEG